MYDVFGGDARQMLLVSRVQLPCHTLRDISTGERMGGHMRPTRPPPPSSSISESFRVAFYRFETRGGGGESEPTCCKNTVNSTAEGAEEAARRLGGGGACRPSVTF